MAAAEVVQKTNAHDVCGAADEKEKRHEELSDKNLDARLTATLQHKAGGSTCKSTALLIIFLSESGDRWAQHTAPCTQQGMLTCNGSVSPCT